MELTVAYLREQFQQFNAHYFNNELPLPRLVVSNSRTRLGQFSCQRVRKGIFRGFKTVGYCIRVSHYFSVVEREYQNVLLHEMIHYYIAYKDIRDTSSHGPEFQKIMRWLNTEHGWNITVSTRTQGWDVAERNRKQQARHVLALETVDGKCFLSVVHRDYIRYVDRLAAQSVFVAKREWFVTTDDYFADFPQTRSLRGRRMKRVEFDEMVQKLRLQERS